MLHTTFLRGERASIVTLSSESSSAGARQRITPRFMRGKRLERLNKEINAALADPKIKAHFASLGGSALAGSPATFATLIADETEKWARVIRFAGIKTK